MSVHSYWFPNCPLTIKCYRFSALIYSDWNFECSYLRQINWTFIPHNLFWTCILILRRRVRTSIIPWYDWIRSRFSFLYRRDRVVANFHQRKMKSPNFVKKKEKCRASVEDMTNNCFFLVTCRKWLSLKYNSLSTQSRLVMAIVGYINFIVGINYLLCFGRTSLVPCWTEIVWSPFNK